MADATDKARPNYQGQIDDVRTVVDRLSAKIDEQARELAGLRKEVVALTVSRPRELTGDEALQIIEADPSRRFLALSPAPALGLRQGDVFDVRAKLANPLRDLPQYIAGGLRITAAPAA